MNFHFSEKDYGVHINIICPQSPDPYYLDSC